MLNDLLAKNQSSDKLYVEDVFSTWLYTGNGSTQTITNGIDLAGKGGMVWTKRRDDASVSHILMDTVRGTGSQLYSNTTGSQGISTNLITAFNSNGYSIGASTAVNASGSNTASWTFRKAPKFFDVVTYTGDGSSTLKVNHNLGVTPGMVIIKRTDVAANWVAAVRKDSGTLSLLYLNTTGSTIGNVGYYPSSSAYVSPTTFGPGYFQNGGVTVAETNVSGGSYVAYLFAHDTTADGIVQCGSYTTDGSGNATVNLGWEPQFVLFKASSTTGSWRMYDNMRGIATGGNDAVLYANLSSAEDTASNAIDLNATGFSVSGQSASATFIYLAIRRGPMRVPTDATKVYTSNATTNTTNAIITTNFAVDLSIDRVKAAGYNWQWQDRLRGSPLIQSNTASAEFTPSPLLFTFDNNTGVKTNGFLDGEGNAQVWSFRRAPGFFDVVCYTTTNSTNQRITHNLGVAPEMIITKNRSIAGGWFTYVAALGRSKYLSLNGTAASNGFGNDWGTSDPTSTDFGYNTQIFQPSPYSGNTVVAYLFATCPGVSKVGTYTGTGTTKQIDCGFTNGARFVLIKRTDSTGDWYVYDSARGIVAGNDPYLLLNSTAAEVTNTDYVDAYSAGFELSSTAPAALNANGGTYIYLAIA